VALLLVMAFAMPLAFATWSALLNNFVIEAAGFTGVEIGWLHTVREIPGFFAVGVIALLIFMREQVLGLVSLVLLGAATAITAWFPSFGGAADGDDALLDRLPLLRDGEPVAAAAMAAEGPRAADPGLDRRRGLGASLLAYGLLWSPGRPSICPTTLRLPDGGGGHGAIALFCLARLPAVRGAEPAGQAHGAAPALLALLRAAVHVGRAAADLRRLRRLHDGRALRLRGARGHRAFPDQLPRQHGLRAADGAAVARFGASAARW
jgi:hypothetical protein